MRPINFPGITLLATLLLPAWSGAAPIASGDTARPECRDALRLATTMFESRATRLNASARFPADLSKRLVLGEVDDRTTVEDLLRPGGAFEKLEKDDDLIHWSKEAGKGQRLVLHESPVGSRGSQYSVYLIEPSIGKNEFLAKLDPAPKATPWPPVVPGQWQPPLIFKGDAPGAQWFIDVGDVFEIYRAWRVFSTQGRGTLCTIAFHAGKEPEDALPAAVRDLASRIDASLGSGRDEGTLNSTARLRLNARKLLATMALRPWALQDEDAYNTRAQVDLGMRNWARGNAARQRLAGEIRAAYPTAEEALANYYTQTFKLPADQARTTAAWSTDLLLRSFFIFQRGAGPARQGSRPANPWPEKG